MPLAGEQLTIKEALALCWVAGFRKEKLVVAVAVMCAESGRYVEAWHDNIGKEGQVASVDRGLFQINSVHEGDISAAEAFDPVHNAGFAFQLSDEGRDWSPWMAYVSGAHEKFLEGVRVVKDEGNWQSRKKMWQ